jgi:tRNA(fMet)-specific endonuclease VapC
MIWDTNALTAFFNQDAQFLSFISASDTPVIPLIVVAEYRFGLEGSSRKADILPRFEAFLSTVSTLACDMETTRHYARIAQQLKTAGRRISQNDLWIAALAAQHHLPVASRDADFDNIEGVERQTW